MNPLSDLHEIGIVLGVFVELLGFLPFSFGFARFFQNLAGRVQLGFNILQDNLKGIFPVLEHPLVLVPVAVHASLLGGHERPAVSAAARLGAFRLHMAGQAVQAGNEHVAGGGRNAAAPLPHEHLFRPAVGFRMADIAVVLHKPHFGGLHAVFDLLMASRAFHFSFGDMGVVHEGDVIVFGETFRFVVTVVTFLPVGVALPLDDVGVTHFTGDVTRAGKILVVEREPLELNILLGEFMTGGAIPQREHPFLFRFVPEVAEEAGAVGHLDVRADNDLGVAACAAQLLAAPEVAQVEFVIEADPFLIGLPLRCQQFLGVASRSQATGVLDLGVGLGAVLLGHILDHGIHRLKLGPQKRFGLRRIMAGDAGDIFVF
jgi:hypothetical protein